MMTAMRVAGCVAAAALCLAGCQKKPEKVDNTSGAFREVSLPIELIAQAHPLIPDLPVPVGFKYDDSRSRHFATAAARWVNHLYKGNDEKFAVSRFYQRQMPTHRWTFVTDRFGQGNIILDFEKQTERCQIIISKGSLLHRTYVNVQLWTTGQIVMPEPQTGKERATK